MRYSDLAEQRKTSSKCRLYLYHVAIPTDVSLLSLKYCQYEANQLDCTVWQGYSYTVCTGNYRRYIPRLPNGRSYHEPPDSVSCIYSIFILASSTPDVSTMSSTGDIFTLSQSIWNSFQKFSYLTAYTLILLKIIKYDCQYHGMVPFAALRNLPRPNH